MEDFEDRLNPVTMFSVQMSKYSGSGSRLSGFCHGSNNLSMPQEGRGNRVVVPIFSVANWSNTREITLPSFLKKASVRLLKKTLD